MANNSNIRNIPLQANCDLAQFGGDLHNYSEFSTSNSLFMNKRVTSWKKRRTSDTELSGDIHYTVDGDDFVLLNESNTELGRVKREYLKLETVEKGDIPEGLNPVVNPFYNLKNEYLCLLPDGITKENVRKLIKWEAAEYTLFYNTETKKKYLYKDDILISNLELIDLDISKNLISFVYLSEDYSSKIIDYNGNVISELKLEGGTPYICTLKIDYTDISLFSCGFSISQTSPWPINYHSIPNNEPTSLYNVIKEEFVNVPVATDNFTLKRGSHYGEGRGAFSVLPLDSTNILVSTMVKGRTVITPSLEDIYRQLSFDIINTNNVSHEDYIKKWDESTVDLSLMLDVQLRETKYQPSVTYTNLNTYSSNSWNLSTPLKIKILKKTNYETVITKNINYGIRANKVFNPENYSIRYGKWAVNFINNTPENIAYEYKKLFYLNGNQDSNGVCTDIDGYNDDYIYFHTQDSYYRISVDVTDNIYDQMINVADYYLIFKTTSYLNAYYIAGNKWFCSCDDWNSRAQWGVTEYSDYWYLLASRKGKPNWINDSDTDTVSSQYPAISQRYALSTKEFSPYDASETWNGTDIIYDADGNEVDTSTWSIGHSLGGYYYISSFTVDPSKMDIFWVDDTYTAPEYEAYNLNTHEWETVKQKYTVYFGDKESSQEQALQKQGYITCDGWTPEPDETEIYSEPESATEYQDNPPLLDTKYIVFTQTILADTSHLIYTLLTSELRRYWLMYYTYEDAAVHEGDREFVINGQLYIYQSSQDRIVDANGTWVANAELFKYIGFSSRCAYFYCEFDKGLYMFTGDNTMSKLTTIEKYQVLFQGSTEDTAITVDSLNIPTIDLVLFNLDDAVGILYGEQFAILETGTINSWSLNTKYGTFVVNGIMYSLNNYNLEKGNIDKWPISTVPVKIETEFYGASGTENNTINDCIYLMLTNLNNNASGEVKVKIKALVNNKEIEGREKVIKITKNDFNNADCCGLKIQPDIQEAYGFKVILESDFEISEFKIGTTPGAMNQTRFRY